jgi:hypothetical protein
VNREINDLQSKRHSKIFIYFPKNILHFAPKTNCSILPYWKLQSSSEKPTEK